MEVTSPGSSLETVKVLRETVFALRRALEGSQKEILRLRTGSLLPGAMDSPGDLQDRSPPQENNSGAESDDIDDIELVFTTGDPDPRSLQEDLVPIQEETNRKFLSDDVIETDISKCGVREDVPRRNTLPDPLPYRPILHREILARVTQGRSPCKALLPPTNETAAQTDITALPAQWKSETHLTHKISSNLTTLPSKFTLPVPQKKRLPLSDKTREARRVLLSDIDFTSMVPELSRSADHLHEEKTTATRTHLDYESPDKYCACLRHDSRSTCGSFCGCFTSSASIPPFVCEEQRRRHSCRPQHVACCHFWSSVPASSGKCLCQQEFGENFCCSRRRRTKVRLLDPFGRSLPNLRGEGDSGDSTDSLLEESEEFIRRSIDSMRISRPRRRSDVESGLERPRTARPFLPKTAQDLQEGCHAKVITPGGRIIVGKVRYAGEVPSEPEAYVGVELSNDTGFSDGVFMGHRFFECGANHAVFVPFGKVVMAWHV